MPWWRPGLVQNKTKRITDRLPLSRRSRTSQLLRPEGQSLNLFLLDNCLHARWVKYSYAAYPTYVSHLNLLLESTPVRTNNFLEDGTGRWKGDHVSDNQIERKGAQ